VEDVLLALDLDHRHAQEWRDTREALLDDEKAFLQAMGRGPRSMEEVALQTTNNVVKTAVLLGRLEAKGWVANTDGWWEALVA
jgi:predicted Rossmann fold nucleotide-binding protein DprA/Smf involved in DNA uptake